MYKDKHHMENVVFIPYQKKGELNYSLNAADVHWCVNSQGIKGVSCPSKYYGISAAAKSVLAVLENGTEIRCIIEQTKSGLCSSPSDYKSIEQNIRWFIENANTEKITEMGKRSRKNLLENLTMEAPIKKYAKENNIGRYFYFEKGKVPTSSQIYQHLMKTFNVDTINFRGFYTGRSLIEDTFLRTVETAADAVMAVFISITALVICLLLVMLIRLKLLREKRDYAIYKALGYTTTNIMTQIAIAMVILGLLGSLVGAIVGGLVTTPLLSLAGSIIGVGRFAFVIPWGYIVGIIFAIPLLIYIVSMLCAIPVKKIAPATLLRERG